MERAITWPKGARCAVTITFDLDGESPWIHRDPALAERPLHMGMSAWPSPSRDRKSACRERV